MGIQKKKNRLLNRQDLKYTLSWMYVPTPPEFSRPTRGNTLILTSQHATMHFYKCMYPGIFNVTYGKSPRGCRILVL